MSTRQSRTTKSPRRQTTTADMHDIDVAIIGGGAAGLACATRILADRPATRLAIFERDCELGGILLQCIHSGFGLSYLGQELTGPEYRTIVLDRTPLDRCQVRLETHVTHIGPDRTVHSLGAAGPETWTCRHVVLATGAREVPFGALAIPSRRPAGIFTAGEAQYLINRQGLMPGRRAVILGAGDIGLIMSRRFIFEGLEVAAVVERQAIPGGMPRNVQTCVHDFDVPLLTGASIVAVHGERRVTGVTVATVTSDGTPRRDVPLRQMACDTLLVAVGLLPEIDLAIELGARRQGRRLETADDGPTGAGRSSVPWLSVCGNARQIHPIVDDVSREGEAVGATVARELSNIASIQGDRE